MSGSNPFIIHPPRKSRRTRWWGDIFFRVLTAGGALVLVGTLLAIVTVLYDGSSASRIQFGFSFLWGWTWNPTTGVFGVLPFLAATLVTSGSP